MLSLRTFGAVYLAGDDGTPLGGAAGQRRLLALLTLVAAAGPSGVSRDRLLSLLWPEADADRARGALAQSLYHARRTLGVDELFVAGTDVRLNPEYLEADVAAFADAVAAEDHERVATLYRGVFLDGFYLTGSAAFEQWVEAQRTTYARQAGIAFDTLARRAEAGDDYRSAVEWHRRSVSLDPLSTAPTLRLMSALAAAGDRGAALQHARIHESLLRDQLDSAPDPAVAALVATLRDTPMAASAATRAAPAVTERDIAAPATRTEAPAAQSAPVNYPAGIAEGSVTTRRTPDRRKRRIALAGAVVLTLTLMGIGIGIARHTATGKAAVTIGQPVVVAPFRVSAADPALAYLREGLVELLSVRLAGDSALRSVDPGVVLHAWRKVAPDAAPDVRRDDAVHAAAALGARQVVVGSVVGTPSRVIVSATLLAVPTGETAAAVTVEGSVDSLTTLVDRIAVGLLAAQAGELERLSRLTTLSLPALRAFLDGQAAYRRDDYSTAAAGYERALTLDSTFALAALQLAVASDRLNDAEQHDRALGLAWSAQQELNARDRAYLIAFAGPHYPAPTPEKEQLSAWERAVALSPDRADAWYELGERYFHEGSVVGLPDGSARAEASLRRALALDPSHVGARRLLILLAARDGRRDALDRFASPAALADSLGDLGPFVRWRAAVARHDEPTLRELRSAFPTLDAANLRMIAMASQFDRVALGDGERALRILRQGRSLRAADLLDVLLAEHSLALNEGHPVIALDVTEQLQDMQPGSRAHLRLRVLDALYGDGDRQAADAAAAELARRFDEPTDSPRADALRLADACVLGQWRLEQGSTRGIDRIVRTLRSTGVPRVSVPVSANPLACAALLEATTAVVARQPDALGRVEDFNALMLSGPAIGDAGTYAHLVVSRLYARLGDQARALAAIRRRPYMAGWPRYQATTYAEEARLVAQSVH